MRPRVDRHRLARWSRWACRAGVHFLLLYLLAFMLLVKGLSGTRSLAGSPHALIDGRIPIFTSGTNPHANRAGKVFFHPLISAGQQAGLWRYMDDLTGCEGGTCLLLYLAGQPGC